MRANPPLSGLAFGVGGWADSHAGGDAEQLNGRPTPWHISHLISHIHISYPISHLPSPTTCCCAVRDGGMGAWPGTRSSRGRLFSCGEDSSLALAFDTTVCCGVALHTTPPHSS